MRLVTTRTALSVRSILEWGLAFKRSRGRMFILLRHHRYEVQIGNQSRILRVDELVSGPAVWGGQFRVRLPADGVIEAKTFYGGSADAVAHEVAELLSRNIS